VKRKVASLVGTMLVAPAAAATLVVQVQNIAEHEGDVLVAVCNAGFDEAGCPIGARRPAGQAGEFRFEGLAPGRYAVAVFQDVNGNGELDRRPPGLPTEPYGFSNDVGRFAPPSFERALVRLDESETAVVVRLGHLFGRE
jgi:uncharacterized protein (DUF2141 family)